MGIPEQPKQNDDLSSAPSSTRPTIRVGKEKVEIDVEAMKQFLDTVRESAPKR